MIIRNLGEMCFIFMKVMQKILMAIKYASFSLCKILFLSYILWGFLSYFITTVVLKTRLSRRTAKSVIF